ncbi:MAG: hypothetical protein WBG24_11685, partial [Syntrophobacteria bacterium]
VDAFANHGDTESTEKIFLPDRETAIGQTGNPPEGWDSKRSAEKRLQPFGHDLVHRWLHVNGCRQAKKLSSEAEALFPGQRPVPLKSGAPGQGKTTLLCILCASVVNLLCSVFLN